MCASLGAFEKGRIIRLLPRVTASDRERTSACPLSRWQFRLELSSISQVGSSLYIGRRVFPRALRSFSAKSSPRKSQLSREVPASLVCFRGPLARKRHGGFLCLRVSRLYKSEKGPFRWKVTSPYGKPIISTKKKTASRKCNQV